MLPTALLRIAPLVAALRLVVAVLPNGDVERATLQPTSEGVQVMVEHQSARSGAKTLERRALPRGRYGWRIEEERRTILMSATGGTGVVRRVYSLSAWVDTSRSPNDPPRPREAFQCYAATREGAEAFRDRIKEALAKRG